MVGYGLHHVLDGADHLLFLVTLLLTAPMVAVGGAWLRRTDALPTARGVLGVVTSFTAGHSVTLIAAAMGWVQVPTRSIEVLVAVSVGVAAVHALRTAGTPRREPDRRRLRAGPRPGVRRDPLRPRPGRHDLRAVTAGVQRRGRARPARGHARDVPVGLPAGAHPLLPDGPPPGRGRRDRGRDRVCGRATRGRRQPVRRRGAGRDRPPWRVAVGLAAVAVAAWLVDRRAVPGHRVGRDHAEVQAARPLGVQAGECSQGSRRSKKVGGPTASDCISAIRSSISGGASFASPARASSSEVK